MTQQQPTKKINMKEAIKMWELKEGTKISEMVEVRLNGWIPPIEKMDASMALLANCEKLSLSTNMIERLNNLNSLKNLKILSVGRNYLKSFSGIEVCADSLEEIWASYNSIEKPSKGVTSCRNLRILYLANNLIREWSEISRLNELTNLEELALRGNMLEERFTATNSSQDWQREVSKKILSLKKLDGMNIVRIEDEE